MKKVLDCFAWFKKNSTKTKLHRFNTAVATGPLVPTERREWSGISVDMHPLFSSTNVENLIFSVETHRRSLLLSFGPRGEEKIRRFEVNSWHVLRLVLIK